MSEEQKSNSSITALGGFFIALYVLSLSAFFFAVYRYTNSILFTIITGIAFLCAFLPALLVYKLRNHHIIKIFALRLRKQREQLTLHANELASEQQRSKQLYCSLIEQYEDIQFILDQIPGGVWYKDTENRIIKVNKAGAGALGFEPHEIEGKSLNELFPEDAEVAYETDRKVIESGKSMRRVARIEQRDGMKMWVQREKIPVTGQDGSCIGLLVFTQNINELMEKKEELSKAHQLQHKVFENIPQRIFWKDRNGNYLGCNQAFANDIGLASPEDVVGLNPDDVIENTGEAAFYKVTDNQVLSENKAMRRALQPFTFRGKTHWIEISKIPLHGDSGEVIGLLGTYEDVTERMAHETELKTARYEAEAASKIKSAFLANVSHEIRTPMNGIMGMADLLNITELNSIQKEYSKAIVQSADSLLQIVNDILDLSKIEANKMDLIYEPVNLTTLMQGFAVMCRENADRKGIDFIVEIDDELPECVRGCTLRLTQVLTNLVGNAIKFTHKGYVALKVSSTRKLANKCFVEFRIEDSGIGIEASKLDKIFDSFIQEDSSTTRNYGGTGLGLAICKKLVVMMNGIIRAESDKGHGSSFIFELPFKYEDEVLEDVCEDLVDSEQVVIDEGMRVLVAEDDGISRKLAATLMTALKCCVHTAENGEQAVEFFKQGNYDVIFMDCQMPVMDGYAATREIRSLEDEHDHPVPIIAMTANAMNKDKQRCLDAGMDAHISKPIRRQTIVETLALYTPSSAKN